jgi:predicted ester cyclase
LNAFFDGMNRSGWLADGDPNQHEQRNADVHHPQMGRHGSHALSHQRKKKEVMSTQNNKQLVLRWKDEIWNKRNLNIVDELYAPDYRGHMNGPIPGREALKQLLAAYFAAFGDIHLTSQFLIAEGEMVAVYDTIRLKHTGTFEGIPPTGKEAVITSTDIYRIVDGRIMEQWTEGDMLGLLQQLGVIPAKGQTR